MFTSACKEATQIGIRPGPLQFGMRSLMMLVAACGMLLAAWCRAPLPNVPRATGRDLDLAILGHGFFRAVDPGTGKFIYTRCGRLSLDANGSLLIGRPKDQFHLEPQCNIPADWTSVSFDRLGELSYRQSGSVNQVMLGRIQLARFTNVEGLEPLAPGWFGETDESGPALLANPGEGVVGAVEQGWLESTDTIFDVVTSETVSRGLQLTAVMALIWLAIEVRRQRRVCERLETWLTRAGADL